MSTVKDSTKLNISDKSGRGGGGENYKMISERFSVEIRSEAQDSCIPVEQKFFK